MVIIVTILVIVLMVTKVMIMVLQNRVIDRTRDCHARL